jgi:hypothetical protein
MIGKTMPARAPNSHHTATDIPPPPSHTPTIVRRHIADHPIAHSQPREREPKRAPHTHAGVSQYGQQGRTTLHVGHGADIPRRDIAVECQCFCKRCAPEANPNQPSCPHTRAKQPSYHHRYPTTTLTHSDHRRHIIDHPIAHSHPRESPCELHTRMWVSVNMGNGGALYCMLVTALTSHAEMSLLKAGACLNTAPPRPTQTNHHAYTRAPNIHHTATDIPLPSHTPTIVGTLPTTPAHASSTHAYGRKPIWATGAHYFACWSRR